MLGARFIPPTALVFDDFRLRPVNDPYTLDFCSIDDARLHRHGSTAVLSQILARFSTDTNNPVCSALFFLSVAKF
jgi:hypothetical protein